MQSTYDPGDASILARTIDTRLTEQPG
jgi:hypothetical protein